MRKLVLVCAAAWVTGVVAAAPPDDLPAWAAAVKLEASLDDPKSVDRFVFSDPAVWKHGKDEKGGFLELAYDRKAYKSTYAPKHRSPVHIALLRRGPFGDCVIDVEMQSTTEPYGHQDLCVFFGVQSPQKYYYVHIARAADMNAHNVFIVNDSPRKNIATGTTKGVDWKKDTWHRVRVIREAKSGKIEIFFDDMMKPIMKAEDRTFASGYVGFGSFDDTGRFRNLRIGLRDQHTEKDLDFFKPLGK
jgi:hypothetical protein